MPLFSFGRRRSHSPPATGRNQAYTAQNTYQIIDNVSWFKGRHNIKFGVDIRRLQVNNQNKPLSIRGSTHLTTASPASATPTSCWAGPGLATRGIARPNAYPRSTYSGFYIQDDFKVHPRVTLNFGLRYEYQTPWVEKFDRMFTFEPSTGQHGDRRFHDSHRSGSAGRCDSADSHGGRRGLPVRSLMFNDRTTSARVWALPSAHSAMPTQ